MTVQLHRLIVNSTTSHRAAGRSGHTAPSATGAPPSRCPSPTQRTGATAWTRSAAPRASTPCSPRGAGGWSQYGMVWYEPHSTAAGLTTSSSRTGSATPQSAAASPPPWRPTTGECCNGGADWADRCIYVLHLTSSRDGRVW